MQLTIAVFDDRVVAVEVEDDATLDTLMAVCEAETGIAKNSQLLIHNGNPLSNSQPLSSQGVQAGDLIMLEKNVNQPPQAARHAPAGASGANIPEAELQALLQQLRSLPQDQLPPPLRHAIETGDMAALARFAQTIASRQQQMSPLDMEEARLRALAERDPFNPEIQQKLEEIIQQRNVDEAFENAMEYHPEVFGTVVMLYINAEVNGIPMQAFVDSGAQMTIMSKGCAEKCGLLRLMDKRFQGMAQGVGQTRILGRIHMAPMVVAGKHIPVSISVLEGEQMKFLLGLDNLKRHQCNIDLQANVLRFPALEVAVPFLAEHEINKDEGFFAQHDEQKAAASGAGAGTSAAAGGGGGGGAAGTAAAGAPPSNVSAPPARPAVAPPSAPPAAASGGGGALPAGWEEKVQRLMALGFPRDQCVGALRAANGNEEIAGSMLFSAF